MNKFTALAVALLFALLGNIAQADTLENRVKTLEQKIQCFHDTAEKWEWNPNCPQPPQNIEDRVTWLESSLGYWKLVKSEKQSNARWVRTMIIGNFADLESRVYQLEQKIGDARTKVLNDVPSWVIPLEVYLVFTPESKLSGTGLDENEFRKTKAALSINLLHMGELLIPEMLGTLQ